ncbi:Por secretion system C-terminal sorting domain-containing protein [Cnuella takakiae]|uniref:Por secretion system C-terminal sorting domain-containing protein n=1 Tax=Cnuella takakiae TaxID=1302690 RepID=A0A1M5IVY7_9BACT|nr:DUF4331 family protein [Cnuella takakiae]OLY91441.1 hypothetical protein BUE76_05635 [Cnuella takakiae]SHG32431.1 Por secretion system C-terminal sorting domain-containing protein [Cnuella takakiae]
MKRRSTTQGLQLFAVLATALFATVLLTSSSHREAPLIAYDPQADNTDLYAFRSPYNPEKVVIIANYIPMQLPQGGPIYYNFGENIRYEIHIDNNIATPGDDIVYRFTFKTKNEANGTFFKIRLEAENQKTSYTLERSMDGGKSFTTLFTNGRVAPYPAGDRSILSPVGLNEPGYLHVRRKAFMNANTGEKVYAGPVDDPFFVDLGGVFDLGDAPRQNGKARDGLKCLNVSTLALEIDISTLQKDKKMAKDAQNILDPNYVIGVWASASRPKIRTLGGNGTETHSGDWVQVSRLGMPLTNEVVNPIVVKDFWNSYTPYKDPFYRNSVGKYFNNPELALYMDDDKFGGAVPAFAPLRIQKASLGQFGFANGQNGLFPLKGSQAVKGTALDDAIFGKVLLPGPGMPRTVDLYPIFHTGVPNLRPYQLLTGKNGNPLASGKPFIHNFLPNGGDMLRLNMAVPTTPRNSKEFSSLGLINAAALGILDPRFNQTTNLQFIPNMDGFPNGRRLEDDVTRIELQAVSGLVLAAIGLPYDDYKEGGPVTTPQLLNVISYTTGVEKNDAPFVDEFPYMALAWPGTHQCNCDEDAKEDASTMKSLLNTIPERKLGIGLGVPEMLLMATPNPARDNSVIRYQVSKPARVVIAAYDATGKIIKVLVNQQQVAGTHQVSWNTSTVAKGAYTVVGSYDGQQVQSIQVIKN